MVYKWKLPNFHKTDPNVAAQVMNELAADGKLTRQNLVDVSRPEDAPLHQEFEWDDTKAAEEYRKEQAKVLIHHLVIEQEDRPQEYPQRVFFNIQSEGPKYEPIDVIITRKDSMEALRKQCLRDLITFKMKYKSILSLMGLAEQVDSLQMSFEVLMNDEGKEEEENV